MTREDWAGVTSPRLGSGKKKRPEKIGKFGLGFSSVYHVTGERQESFRQAELLTDLYP